MTEMMKNFAERLALKTRLFEQFKDNYPDNWRECPFFSERRGIEEALQLMGIDYEYEFNEEVTAITAVTVMGQRVEL